MFVPLRFMFSAALVLLLSLPSGSARGQEAANSETLFTVPPLLGYTFASLGDGQALSPVDQSRPLDTPFKA